MTENTTAQHHFSTNDIAGILEIAVMTVRRWAEYHADHLSAGANPPSGIVRRFTWADVETYRQIKAWRDAGLSVDVINFKLAERNTKATLSATTSITAVAPESNLSPQEGQGDAPALIVALQAMQTDIEALKASSQASENRQRDQWWWLVVGIGIGLGLAVVFELAALVVYRVR